jgi:hypothetical protein
MSACGKCSTFLNERPSTTVPDLSPTANPSSGGMSGLPNNSAAVQPTQQNRFTWWAPLLNESRNGPWWVAYDLLSTLPIANPGWGFDWPHGGGIGPQGGADPPLDPPSISEPPSAVLLGICGVIVIVASRLRVFHRSRGKRLAATPTD